MPAGVVKNVNGVLMLIFHFGAIYFVFERVSVRLRPEDQLALVMILSPLTATFVSLFLKDAVKNAQRDPDLRYTYSFSTITLIITVLYGLTIFFLMNNFVNNTDVSPDMLKLYVGVIETVIGGFVGIVYGELFK